MVLVVAMAVATLVLFVFAVAIVIKTGMLAVIGLGARLGLRYVFANGSTGGSASTGTHNSAIFTPH